MEAGQSFLSSSSTLGAAFDLMDQSVERVVGDSLPPDPREVELMKELED